MEALQLEQQTLRDTVTELTTTKAKIGGGASTHEPSTRADNKDNNSPIQMTQQPPSGSHSGSGQPIAGTVLKAIKAGAYVDFLDLLPRLKVKPDTWQCYLWNRRSESKRDPERNYRIVRLVSRGVEHL